MLAFFMPKYSQKSFLIFIKGLSYTDIMVEYNFEIKNEVIGYVRDYLTNKNLVGDIYMQEGMAIVNIKASEEQCKTMLADIILNFHKLALIVKTIDFGREPTLAECAFLGAVMSLEKSIETAKILAIADKTEIKNVEGFYNFCLCSMQESWENLAILSKKLLGQCKCEKDIYSLTGFMLGIDDDIKNNIIVDYPKIYLGKDDEKISIMNYFNDKEKDMIVAILAQNPSDIIVIDSEKVTKKFMQVIRALGE